MSGKDLAKGRRRTSVLLKGGVPVIITIDRFEGDLAVIEYGGRTFPLPAILLPKEAREGDVLQVSIEVDLAATADRRRRIAEKEDRLFRK